MDTIQAILDVARALVSTHPHARDDDHRLDLPDPGGAPRYRAAAVPRLLLEVYLPLDPERATYQAIICRDTRNPRSWTYVITRQGLYKLALLFTDQLVLNPVAPSDPALTLSVLRKA